MKWEQFIEQELIQYADLEDLYLKYINNYFDLAAIRKSGIKTAFDPMYGSGQKIIRKVLPDARSLHCEPDPMFGGIAPEPLERNLQELIGFMKSSGKYDVAIALDGDGDRIALVNKDGKYIDSHHIILILIHYLAKYRKMGGKVVTGFSSTVKVEKLCQHYDLDAMRVPIGFKDICRVMLSEEVMVGGEESGGISVSGYLPERDGIWMGLTILQFMAETGKSLETILNEIYQITGKFHCMRRDIQIPREKRGKIMDLCYKGEIESFGRFPVSRIEALDGIKFFINDDEWFMVRASGTEPLLRTYAEASDPAATEELLEEAYKTLTDLASRIQPDG